jgi:hypothetical protein
MACQRRWATLGMAVRGKNLRVILDTGVGIAVGLWAAIHVGAWGREAAVKIAGHLGGERCGRLRR